MAVGTENPKMYQMSWGFCLLPPLGSPLPPISNFSPSAPRIRLKRTIYLQKVVFNGVYKVS